MSASEIVSTLRSMRLAGMADSFELQMSSRAYDDLSCEEIIGNMCIAQKQHNADRFLQTLKSKARFRHSAQLDKPSVRALLSADWVIRTENLLLSGPAGTGKSWFGCALGYVAIRAELAVRYFRTNLMLEELRKGHVDGSIGKLRKALLTPRLIILNDFGIAPIPEASKEDLFELLESRCDNGSIMIIGQLAPIEWHSFLDTSHMADAMMDRIVQRAHSVELKGDSLRKRL